MKWVGSSEVGSGRAILLLFVLCRHLIVVFCILLSVLFCSMFYFILSCMHMPLWSRMCVELEQQGGAT